jgi:hypothetical protein
MRGTLPTFHLQLYDVKTLPLHQAHWLNRQLQKFILEMSVCYRYWRTDYIEIAFFKAVLKYAQHCPTITLPNNLESSKHWQLCLLVLQNATENKLGVNNLTVFNTGLTAILKMEAVFSSESF